VRAGGDATLVGVVTFDSSVHFYSVSKGQAVAQMLVMPDVSDVYAPMSSSLLARLSDAREHLAELLSSIPGMFAAGQGPESCGAAAIEVRTQGGAVARGMQARSTRSSWCSSSLRACRAACCACASPQPTRLRRAPCPLPPPAPLRARAPRQACVELLKPTGGKLHAFLAGLPNTGSKALKMREGGASLAEKEKQMGLLPQDNTYLTLAAQAADFNVRALCARAWHTPRPRLACW
jgi:hypothetical protein